MKTVTILGSTGSIGKNSLEIIGNNPDKLKVKALAAHSDIKTIVSQAQYYKPEFVALASNKYEVKLRQALAGTGIKVACGQEAATEAAALENTDYIVAAITGAAGLKPVMAAIEKGRRICLANKESLVVAGKLVTDAAQKHNAQIIPVDSEHSAIFQCIEGQNSLKKIILTASGGPFRGISKNQLSQVTVKEALKHPNWNMGRKISIDSATMMNKGLEVIEAKWLFDVEADRIETIVHPESIIHSMVEFHDTSVIAQMGVPDMKVPIQYALSFPKRLKAEYETLDLRKVAALHFEQTDRDRFPCLQLAYDALEIGGTMPAVLNGANEVLVEAYLEGKISFYGISDGIRQAMDAHEAFHYTTMEEILEVDRWSRDYVRKALK